MDCVCDSRLSRLLLAVVFSVFLHIFVVFVLPVCSDSKARGSGVVSAVRYHAVFRGRRDVSKPVFPSAQIAKFKNDVLLSSPEHELSVSESSAKSYGQILTEMAFPQEPHVQDDSGTDFFTPDLLTVKPKPLSEPEFDLAEDSDIAASDRVVLSLWINAQGDMVDVSLDEGDLTNAFSQAAVVAFRRLSFVPGEINGEKVGSVMSIEVIYEAVSIPPSF